MSTDARNDQPQQSRPRVLVAGGGVVAMGGVGWFVLSHFVMRTSTEDAIGEAVGVVLALLVVASIVGAVASSGGNHG